VSDLLRYEILAAVGGVYVDVDMQAVRPLDALLHAAGGAAVLGVSNTAAFELNNAVLAAPPRHALLLDLVGTTGVGTAGDGGSSFMDTIATTGPGAVTRAVFHGLDAGVYSLWRAAAPPPPSHISVPVLDTARWDAAVAAIRRHVYDTHSDATPATVHTGTRGEGRLAPPRLLYPLPNTAAAAVAPAALSCTDAEWEAIAAATTAATSSSDPTATAAALDAMLGPSVMAYTHGPPPSGAPVSLAVHFWARTWQRPAAQRPAS